MIRQADIAKKLGLSESSVSRILSGQSNHDDQTRANVLALAAGLGYRHLRPTVRKVTGRKDKTPLLEILIEASDEARSHLPAVVLRLLHGISEGARMENASIHVEYINTQEGRQVHLPQNQPSNSKKNHVGTVLIGHYPVETLRELSRQLPCVWVCNADQEIAPDSVGQNDMHATDELFNHLRQLGHRKIGFLSEPPDFWPIQARLGGYAVALAKRYVPYDPSAVIVGPTPLNAAPWDETFAKALKQIRNGVTGWICNHDDVAYDFARYLQEHGVRVPEEVSLCGFDNLPHKKDLPKLTTIEWPFEDIGLMAVRRVLRRVREMDVATVSINFSGRLIPGESTAPASSAV